MRGVINLFFCRFVRMASRIYGTCMFYVRCLPFPIISIGIRAQLMSRKNDAGIFLQRQRRHVRRITLIIVSAVILISRQHLTCSSDINGVCMQHYNACVHLLVIDLSSKALINFKTAINREESPLLYTLLCDTMESHVVRDALPNDK